MQEIVVDRISFKTFMTIYWITAILLIIGSRALAVLYSGGKPFYGEPSVGDALVFVGVPTVMICVWFVWSLVLLLLILFRRIPWWMIIALSLPLVALTLLHTAMFGYISDLSEAYVNIR